MQTNPITVFDVNMFAADEQLMLNPTRMIQANGPNYSNCGNNGGYRVFHKYYRPVNREKK